MPSKPSKRREPQPRESAPPPPSLAERLQPFLDRYSVAIAVFLVLIASLRIAGVYWTYSHTADEPAHIVCGVEWLDRGTYTFEAQHPPLARVAAAIGPYLLGSRVAGPGGDTTVPTGTEDDYGRRFHTMNNAALAMIFAGGRYDQTLAAARAGILPFFWLACLVVYLWAKRDFGAPVAVAALFLFTMLPPILAHAGLATTDMALTATLGAAMLAARVWFDRPTLSTAALFGLCGALAVLTKFSSLVFFPAAVAVILFWRAASGPVAGGLGKFVRDRLPTFAVAVAVLFVVVWAGYRFSFGKVYFANIRLPFPELFVGILEVQQHNARGHLSYLLGELRLTGCWYYYLVVLAVKTPIGFLALALAGAVTAVRARRNDFRAQVALAFSLAILAVGMFSRINIGVRHILPIYLGFSILAGLALWRALEARPRSWLAGAGLVAAAWMTISSAAAHPDYLPYFNEIAGSHPERILVDSDLDWGQDVKRLRARLAQVGAKSVAFSFLGEDVHQQLGMPPTRPNSPLAPYEGWNAVSLTMWKGIRFGLGMFRPDLNLWPDSEPPGEKVGQGIVIWYFPPAAPGQSRPLAR